MLKVIAQTKKKKGVSYTRKGTYVLVVNAMLNIMVDLNIMLVSIIGTELN